MGMKFCRAVLGGRTGWGGVGWVEADGATVRKGSVVIIRFCTLLRQTFAHVSSLALRTFLLRPLLNAFGFISSEHSLAIPRRKLALLLIMARPTDVMSSRRITT